MADSDKAPPPAVAGEQAEARSQIYDLVSRVGKLEGNKEHMASKADVAKAKTWMIVTIAAALISNLTLLFNFLRLYFSFKAIAPAP